MKWSILMVMVLLLVSCSPVNAPGIGIDNPFAPQKGDEKMIESPAYVEVAEWKMAEGRLHISGDLPTPCHRLRIASRMEDNQLHFDLYSLSLPEEVCLQVLQPFEASVGIRNLPMGGVSIFVNGTRVKTA